LTSKTVSIEQIGFEHNINIETKTKRQVVKATGDTGGSQSGKQHQSYSKTIQNSTKSNLLLEKTMERHL
jgi:hypothetical protein